MSESQTMPGDLSFVYEHHSEGTYAVLVVGHKTTKIRTEIQMHDSEDVIMQRLLQKFINE